MAAPAGVTCIAFYLPQFHPIPENDEWWGKGFTEWTNVSKARPLFRGHAQPDLPADLGFYDLRVPETRTTQSELAATYGVSAFCYWHYWFAGRQLLQRPFEEVLTSGLPDIKFCLGWANQSWSGVWHGAPDRVLIEQTYPGDDDHRRHFAALSAAFHDTRYLRVDEKPVVHIYRPCDLPDAPRVLDLWRALAQADGLPGLYFTGETTTEFDPRSVGFDGRVRNPTTHVPPDSYFSRSWRSWRSLPRRYPMARVAKDYLAASFGVDDHPCLLPNWDNTPRSGGDGLVLTEATPQLFRASVEAVVDQLRSLPSNRRLLFVKSWNEWAEGNHLEPCARFGHGFLEGLRAGLSPRRPI